MGAICVQTVVPRASASYGHKVICGELRNAQIQIVAAGPLGEEAGRQLQPLGAQLTRLSLQEGGEASRVTAGAAKVDCLCSIT